MVLNSVFSVVIFLWLAGTSFGEQYVDPCSDLLSTESLYAGIYSSVGVSHGASVEESDSAHMVGTSAGMRLGKLADICQSLSLSLFQGSVKFKDNDNGFPSNLEINIGMTIGLAGLLPLADGFVAFLGVEAGAADTSYSTEGPSSYKPSSKWGGRLGAISAGVKWAAIEKTIIDAGPSITHIVTGAGQQRGDEGDGFASVASNDQGKAVNLNMICLRVGVAFYL